MKSFCSFSICVVLAALCSTLAGAAESDAPREDRAIDLRRGFDGEITANAIELITEGRRTFRYDTFGDEAFWGGQLALHEAIADVTPRQALDVGLKVDSASLSPRMRAAIRSGRANLDDAATTMALLQADAVIGVRGFFDATGNMASIGITCALCHSTVDDSLATGVGRRRDGWPNRDLNVRRDRLPRT